MNRVLSSSRLPRRVAAALAALEPLLLLLLAPLFLFPPTWIHLLAPLLLLPWFGRVLAYGRLTYRSLLNAPTFLILLLGILAYTVSVDRAVSHPILWGIVFQTALFFVVLNLLDTTQRLRRAYWLLLAMPPAVALFALFGVDWSLVRLLPLEGLYQHLPSLELLARLPGNNLPTSAPLFHPRVVGATLGFLLPLPLAALFFHSAERAQTPGPRLLAALAALPAFIVLMLTQTPMGFFGLAVALAFFAFCWRPWTLIPVALAGLALFIAPFWLAGPRALAASLLDLQHLLGVGFVLRFDMWSRALAMIGDMPLTGVGLNTFPLILSHFYPGLLLGPEPHAHNLLLQTAVDLGVPGLLALAWLFAGYFRQLARAYAHHAEPWQRALLLGLAGGALSYLAGGALDALTLGAKPLVALWLMLGAAAAAGRLLPQRPDAPAASTRPARPWRRFAFPGLLLILLTLIPLAAPGLPSANLGAAYAHRAIFTARQAGSLPAQEATLGLDHLQQALAHRPRDPHLHGLLASLHAWQGNDHAALDHLQQRVALDGPHGFDAYAPFVNWQRALQNTPPSPPWEDTIRLYRTWTNRYPFRAENPVLLALALHNQDRPEAALAALRDAVNRNAQPTPLLTHALQTLP